MNLNRIALTANIAVGVDALRIHPLRTVLSILGIIIGSASLVATMAVSDGIMGFARGQIERETAVQVISVGSRTITYRDGQWVAIPDYPVFTPADLESARRNIQGIGAATMVLNGRVVARYRGTAHETALTLGTDALPDFSVIKIGAGRFFSAIEASRNAPVTVINYALARELAPERDPYDLVGTEIHLNRRLRRVIGVL